MYVDRDGKQMRPIGAMEASIEQIDRLRDLTIVRLSAKGWTQRQIAEFLKIDQSNVCRRLKGVPPHVRERVRKQALDELG